MISARVVVVVVIEVASVIDRKGLARAGSWFMIYYLSNLPSRHWYYSNWNVLGNNNTILGNNKPLQAPSCSRSTAADNRDTHTHTLLRVPVAVGGAIHSLPKSPPLALPPIWVSMGSESFRFWSGVHSDLDFFQARREWGVRARPRSQSLKADTEDWARICDLPSSPDQVITLSM